MTRKISLLLAFLIGIIITLLVPWILLATGTFNVAATAEPGPIEKTLAPWAVEQSLKKRAPQAQNPLEPTQTVLSDGLDHFREMCVLCHGAPGVEPADIGKGLNPAAPELSRPDTQEMTDGQLFWVIKNGIRMSGMAAFGASHSEQDIWKLVAFIRHLPKLTAGERKTLSEATAEEEEHNKKEGPTSESAPKSESKPNTPPAQ